MMNGRTYYRIAVRCRHWTGRETEANPLKLLDPRYVSGVVLLLKLAIDVCDSRVLSDILGQGRLAIYHTAISPNRAHSNARLEP